MKTLLYGILALFCLFVGLWIAQDNSQQVGVTLLGFSLADLSLGLWLLFAFVTGVIFGLLVTLPLLWRQARDNRKLRRQTVSPATR
ncbi:MAG: LapA family protein [Porticoccaceae bacterium]|jgi:uncharacterized integral membrane protein